MTVGTPSQWKTGPCDVCGRVRNVGISRSAWRESREYWNCQSCLEKPAETLSTFKFMYDNKPKGGFDTRLKNWYTWIDGRYVHWTTYVEMRNKEKTSASG